MTFELPTTPLTCEENHTLRYLPRLIRFKEAPRYLGMDRHCFNREVRPYIAPIRIGKQGIAFDRLDLDAWVTEAKKQAEPKLHLLSSPLRNTFNFAKTKKQLSIASSQIDFEKFIDELLKKNRRR